MKVITGSITSGINYLHLGPCLQVCFGENQAKIKREKLENNIEGGMMARGRRKLKGSSSWRERADETGTEWETGKTREEMSASSTKRPLLTAPSPMPACQTTNPTNKCLPPQRLAHPPVPTGGSQHWPLVTGTGSGSQRRGQGLAPWLSPSRAHPALNHQSGPTFLQSHWVETLSQIIGPVKLSTPGV